MILITHRRIGATSWFQPSQLQLRFSTPFFLLPFVFQLLTPLLLWSSSALSIHLTRGRPTFFVPPAFVVHVKFSARRSSSVVNRCPDHLNLNHFNILNDIGLVIQLVKFVTVPNSPLSIYLYWAVYIYTLLKSFFQIY